MKDDSFSSFFCRILSKELEAEMSAWLRSPDLVMPEVKSQEHGGRPRFQLAG